MAMEEISEEKNITRDLHSTKKRLSRKKLSIIIAIVLGVLVVLGAALSYFYYNNHKKNTYSFLQELSKYDDGAEKFEQAWPSIIIKTKTPIQYLMVLKRLDAFELTEKYRNTLIRALYKYPDIHSFLALAVEYYLSYYDGTVFEEFFDKVDELWNNYPNLVRLYYINQYELHQMRYTGDEILDIFYDIEVGNYTWNTLKLLWELTEEPVFLYFASVQAEIVGLKDIAISLYNDLPVEWQSLHVDHYIELSWILRNTEFLLPIVKSNKNIQEYIQLASYYVLDDKTFRAFNLLTEAYENLPEASLKSSDFISLYFWLALYQMNQKDIILQFLDRLEKVNDTNLQIVFLFYLYQYDVDTYFAYTERLSPGIYESISQNELFQFFQMNIESSTIEHRKVFLWTLLNNLYYGENKNGTPFERYWVKMAANFFLNYRLLDDFLILYDKYKEIYAVELIPYYLFFKLNFVNLPLTELDIQELVVNANINNYPWWFFYNLGVWKLNNEDLLLAKEYFEQAIKDIELEYTIGYKEYPFAQLVRVYIQLNEIDKAEEIFEDLTTLFPVNPLIFSLESSMKHFKSIIMEKKAIEESLQNIHTNSTQEENE